MLQDKYLSQFDFSKSESIEINAPVDKVYPLIETVNFKKSKIIYWLFKLRGIPVRDGLTLKELEKINFVRLEEFPNKEIIVGLIGQFWTPTGRLKRINPEEFKSFDQPEYAKATWNFELTEVNDFKTRLTTETRIYCPTPEIKKKFKFYWTFIQPFSSWIRIEILKAIKKQAEIN